MSDTKITDQEALDFHTRGQPGKIALRATKPLTTQRDLSLAYSPGVAVPCLEIEKNPDTAYDFTSKGNMVAVISNGTAVLGLGNIGALASKPVMEGKAVLFKRFADIDGFDLEVETEDVDDFISCVRLIGNAFGGINLEDIKAPECFIIEQKLREELNVPVFHDDQHGTAIIAAAGMINALDLTGRKMKDINMVVNGAGASAIACIELIKSMGVPHNNVVLCDSKGVIYLGREDGMNQWKSAHAVPTEARSLADAVKNADVLFGLSVKGAVSAEMVKSMADKPIIFAMANPDPEITPEEVAAIRDDAIMATGRSDYANQINNVLGFPYIFRGALDVRASTINDQMKSAAAQALAALAREDVPDEVDAAYGGRRLRYGPEYIIPVPFDPRLISAIPPAVAQAAMDSKVARKPIADMNGYRQQLSARLDPTTSKLQFIFQRVRAEKKRIVFAEGEEERVIRAALAFRNAGYGEPILLGRAERVEETMASLGIEGTADLEIHNAALSTDKTTYSDYLFGRLQRRGFLFRDCARLVNQDRNIFGACMVACGDADGMVTGVTRPFAVAYSEVSRVIDAKEGECPMGITIMMAQEKTIFIADSRIHELPTSEELAEIACGGANYARKIGQEPRVAFLSFSNFGQPKRSQMERVRKAVSLLDERKVDFEYDGEMNVDTALDFNLMQRLYPFCRLSGPANVLVMPELHSSSISSKLLQALGDGTVIGPVLEGLSKPVQFVQLGCRVNDLVQAAAFAAYDSIN
ncbi:MAG: NADP-dependent malic enzyme [Rhodospirillaceae bacterium]|nr:NADP-dependent malic enzyme [Rhodospirillaceae bacterium]|tara:strand:- start:1923 stop:4184 length:2262 start_codon:yes stop_codon:yes gene_type:complete